MGLQDEAKEKNVRVSKMYPGNRFALLCLATGKTLAVFDSLEEVREAVKNRADYVAPKDVVKVSVGWSDTYERKQNSPRPCPNGQGFDCFCLDPMEDMIIFCPVIGCQRRAACLGVCDEHYGYARLMGHNAKKEAVGATQAMLEEFLILDGETAETAVSTYDRAVANLASGRFTHVNLKHPQMLGTEGSATSLTRVDLSVVADLPGVTVRFIGTGEGAIYAAFDKDGHILAQHSDKASLLKMLAWDDE